MEVPLQSCLLVIAVLCIANSESQHEQTIKNCKPPSIRKQVEADTLYFIDDTEVEIPCIAKGHEKLIYTWEKNGKPFDVNSPPVNSSVIMGPETGTLHITAQQADEGLYQCFVTNECGTSLSRKFLLSRARLIPFPLRDKPVEIRAALGSSLKLDCKPPESVPRAKITWVLTDSKKQQNYDDPNGKDTGFKSVTLDTRVTMDYEGNLYITSIKKEDEQGGKIYVCQAENIFTRSTNIGEDKKILVLGMTGSDRGVELMWHSGNETMVLEGRRARFKCIFSGFPEPRISWSRVTGGDLDRTRMIAEGHELLINDVQFADAGEYRCSGQNTLSPESKSHTFTLNVESTPQWKNTPRNTDAGVEESASFECEAIGHPTPTVEWFINGKPYDEAPDNPRRVLKDNLLSFTKLENHDSQVIQCNASNIHGYKWSDVYLYVEASAPVIQQKPLERTLVAEGQDARISCHVTGKPKPLMIWYKGGQILVHDKYEILDTGDLIIKGAEMKDNGDYRCFAENRYGKAEAEGEFIVRERTQIISGPKSEQVDYTNPYTFYCGAATDPKEFDNLRYRWLKNGEEIKPSDRVIIKQGNLTITETNSKDTALYTCVAENGLDNATADATLQVKAVPDPPYNVSVEDCLAKKATIKWKFEEKMRNFDTMTKFIIEYTTAYKPGVWTETKSMPYPADMATIDLSPYAQYKFRVKAVNLMGISDPSDSTYSWCETPSSVPDRNPDNVHTDESTTGYLVVRWKPMDQIELNGPEFHYIVEVQEAGEGTDLKTFKVDDHTVGEKRIKVDNIYRPYHVRVRAANEKGRAMLNPITVFGHSGEAPPLVVPENFELDPDVNVTSTSAGFRWDPVDTSPELIRGEFSGYKIRFWKAGQKDISMHEHIVQAHPNGGQRGRRDAGDGKMRGVVANLPSYAEVEADIVVINKNFESNSSNTVNFSTPEGVPGRVEYLEALYRGSHHFLLQWGRPKEQNGIITGYQVAYRKIIKLDFEPKIIAFANLTPDTDRVTLKDLDPDSQYRIFIQAMTVKGLGREYYIDVRTISNVSLMALPIVKHVFASEKEANVTWEITPSEKGTRHGQMYIIEYKKKDAKDWNSVKQPEGQLWGVLKQLEPGTPYEVRVQAVASEGGAHFPSDIYSFKTAGFDAARASFLTAAWFIGMMVAICLLILILIIICIIKRNRGDNYPVQEKERLRGPYNDENQDHFNGFGKGDENGVRGSNSFDQDAEKVPLDEDVDSLDYGDDDASKFNEDGSFIGQYGRGEKANEATNASSIV